MRGTAENPFDLFVIGGGINGCGIARDAAGRGFSVCLAEMNDLASGTSSWSTKLIHGGLRYLEYYEFRLVREALMERELLWRNAPHIIRPLRFVLPHHKGLRPAWLLRLGLFLYDHIGGRRLLPPTRTLNMHVNPVGEPLKPLFTKAFEYSDCWVDDARLVVLNARDAADRGADIRTRTKVIGVQRDDGLWRITTESAEGTSHEVAARLVVNAAGPWVDKVLMRAVGVNRARNVRLVQGSHIVVPKLYDHDSCYIFQNADGRILFAIPYERDFTLIGTTDQDYEGDPGDVAITEPEITYLCEAASAYFAEPIEPEHIVWTYSGVRPLFDDGATKAQAATRDYVIRLEGDDDRGRILNIYGGKLTTFRRLADAAMDKIESVLGRKGTPWTDRAPLPGGDFDVLAYDQALADAVKTYSFMPEADVARLFRHYGTRMSSMLAASRSIEDLGEHFGAGLYEAEIRYLMDQEWATTADDVLWRRTKLGLRVSQPDAERLTRFMDTDPQRALAADQTP
ncbi:MAG: glycerol-3-phosphate dehydrogenase [Pseudomonadota bacterium]